MQAVILAAGMGKRLGEYTHDNTKCMVEVNGVKLIDRTLSCLHGINVSRVILVVGYKGQNVKDHVGTDFHGTPIVYVENPVYDKTNNIYSLYLAKDYMVEEDTILLESDLIYEPQVLKKLLAEDYPNIALVDKYENWMDGTVVTIDEDRHITQFIDKDHFKYEDVKSYYKTVNIYKFSKEFSAKYYIPFLAAYCSALGNNEYYEQVLRVILHLHNAPLKALPLSGEAWYEIDDVQDLDIASGMFAPTEDAHFAAISSRYGHWRYPQVRDFCNLVNPYFPPQRMIDEIKASFETLMRGYPSGMRVNSLLASKNFGVKQEYILVGNGAAELIKAYMENRRGKQGIILPTFEEYPNRVKEEDCIQFVLDNEGFRYSAEDIKGFFADKDIDTLLLVNPDNPSGNFIPFQDVLGLIAWTKKMGVDFIIDESFVDFAGTDATFTLFDNAILAANPHLVVVKSISKSYGVPGFRLGVLASGNTDVITRLKKEVAIWNINSFGEFYMQISGKYHKDYDQACVAFREERDAFFKELAAIPFLKVYPSQANFFLCKVTDRFTAHELALKLLKHNILVKDCGDGKAFNGGDFIRFAVRDRKDNGYLIEILKSL